jgi:hypothetical protein
MLEVLQVSGPVVAFRAEGTLSGDDYDRMTAELERQLGAHERIGLFADVSALDSLSFAALARDLQYSLAKLGELHRFEHVAVVSEKSWLRVWAQYAWLLVPKSTVRTFQSSERDAALVWASELKEMPVQHALRWIPTTRPDTYAFVWNGTITDRDVDDVLTKLERELESHISVRMLARIERMGGIRSHALLRSTFMRLKALGLRKVERYAIVARGMWIKRYVDIACRLTTIDMRYFPIEREREAWAWLEAEPSERAAEPESGQAEVGASN